MVWWLASALTKKPCAWLTMVIQFAAGDFHEHGCDLLWQLNDKASGREVARGKHGIVFFDYATRSKVKVPAAFAERMGAA